MIAISEEVLTELQTLCFAMALGGCLAAVYDVVRILRRIVPRGIIWVSLEDLCYWTCVWLLIFIFLAEQNSGGLRGYIVGAIALGAVIYHYLFGKWIILGASYAIVWAKKELKKLKKAVTIILEKCFK